MLLMLTEEHDNQIINAIQCTSVDCQKKHPCLSSHLHECLIYQTRFKVTGVDDLQSIRLIDESIASAIEVLTFEAEEMSFGSFLL